MKPRWIALAVLAAASAAAQADVQVNFIKSDPTDAESMSSSTDSDFRQSPARL